VPNDVYHDCHEAPGKKRAAHLDFNFKFDEVGEQPALRFDTVGNSQPTNDFFSPLEAALLDELGNGDTDEEEESGEETDDIPTEEESTWVSLMKKAKGTLMMGLSPATAKDELKESEHGVHSRRDRAHFNLHDQLRASVLLADEARKLRRHTAGKVVSEASFALAILEKEGL
jgi:hypothetical protein